MDNTTAQTLSVTDLAVIKNIIDVATERGAFRAPELATVGGVYNKLTAFLDRVVKDAEAQEASDLADAQPQGETR